MGGIGRVVASVWLWRRNEPRGAEQQRLHRCELVGMFVEKRQRHLFCQEFERLAVEPEPESARQGHVGGPLPVSGGLLYNGEHALGLAVEAFHGQGREPVGAVD